MEAIRTPSAGIYRLAAIIVPKPEKNVQLVLQRPGSTLTGNLQICRPSVTQKSGLEFETIGTLSKDGKVKLTAPEKARANPLAPVFLYQIP